MQFCWYAGGNEGTRFFLIIFRFCFFVTSPSSQLFCFCWPRVAFFVAVLVCCFFRPKHHVGFYLLEQRFLVAADFPSFFVPGQVLVDLQKSEKKYQIQCNLDLARLLVTTKTVTKRIMSLQCNLVLVTLNLETLNLVT